MRFHGVLAGQMAAYEATDILSVTAFVLHEKEMARRFLKILDPNATDFTFQFFADDKNRRPARTVHDTLDAIWPYVEQVNVPGCNIGVFVTVNETDGKGRKTANIIRPRALFVDADSRKAVERCRDIITKSGATPTAMVKTSDEKAHLYWCVDDLSLEEFDHWQAALVAKFDTDPAARDRPRVMRLPGTLHLKSPANPRLVRLIGSGSAGSRWSCSEIVERLGLDKVRVGSATDGPVASPVFEIEGAILSKRFAPSLVYANDDLSAGVTVRGWFDGLLPEQKDQCLKAMLDICHALAKARRDIWLPIVIAAYASRAPNAEIITLEWCKTGGEKFRSEADFQKDWDSFGKNRSDRITVGTLIKAAEDRGFVSAPWKALARLGQAPEASLPRVASPGITVPAKSPNATLPIPAPCTPVSFTRIPHRQWLYGTDLVRGEITLLASPGGIGKSSLAIGMATAVATGKRLLDEQVFGKDLRALYVNGEDSHIEMVRRLYAFCLQHNLKEHDIGRLGLLGADEATVQNISFLRTEKGTAVINSAGIELLDTILSSERSDILVLDPLVSFCGGGNMNDNAAMSLVMRELKRLAGKHKCAVLIIHHTRKGSDLTSAEAIGGASAIVNLARKAIMALPMTDEEANKLGVVPSKRGSYFRAAAAKANLAPRSTDADWYELCSVTLPNPEPPTYPYGDGVQAIQRVQLAQIVTTSSNDPLIQKAILDTVDIGKMVDGHVVPYSPSPAGANKKRSLHDDAMGAARATPIGGQMAEADLQVTVKRCITDMTARGWLSEEILSGGPFRRGRGLRVHWDQTPWAAEKPTDS